MYKTRVLFVIGQLSVGGTELQLLQLARGLNRERFEPMVVCLSGVSASLFPKFHENNIPTVVLAREEQGRLRTLWKLARVIKNFNPAVIHAFAYASRAAIPVSKIFSKPKTIVSIRTQPNWQTNWLDKLINPFADMILTNSQKAATSIDFGHWRNVPVQVIYNGIDLQKFDRDICGDFVKGTPAGRKVICSVARLHHIKGLNVLLEAFAVLSKSTDGVELWIVGDGPEKKNLEEQAIQLGIDSRVIFWGQQENVSMILREANIGVLSSHCEGLPNVVIEYMAAGLPVVATNVGGLPELVIPSKNGFLVTPDNPDELASALMLLIKDPQMARTFGKNGRAFIEQCFVMEKMIADTERIYGDLCQQQ
jgi:glycosyltransferase involved in cell wall biosynthesis